MYRPQGMDPNDGQTIVLVDATDGLAIESMSALVPGYPSM